MADSKVFDRMIPVGRRQLHPINSWMHNIRLLNRGPDKCTALMHPDDAARCRVGTSERVEITRGCGFSGAGGPRRRSPATLGGGLNAE